MIAATALSATALKAVPPLTSACALPFWFTQNTALRILRNDNTTDNEGKINNYVQT